jgi:hypothetical protein
MREDLLGELAYTMETEKFQNRLSTGWRPWEAGRMAQTKTKGSQWCNSWSETESLRMEDVGVLVCVLESQGQRDWTSDVQGKEEENVPALGTQLDRGTGLVLAHIEGSLSHSVY